MSSLAVSIFHFICAQIVSISRNEKQKILHFLFLFEFINTQQRHTHTLCSFRIQFPFIIHLISIASIHGNGERDLHI